MFPTASTHRPPGRRGAEFLAVLAREHREHPLPPGLRGLAGDFVGTVLGLLFPHFARWRNIEELDLAAELDALTGILERALGDDRAVEAGSGDPSGLAEVLLDRLAPLRDKLLLDATAIYDGDPAARSVDEVIVAYPGFLATAIYRVAHELHPEAALFSRLVTEVAHGATGIDIHPAARIGESFAIDHGTGIVIGETAAIGSRARLYQGVTLGAVRVNKRLEHRKRHPTIGDDVVIYANATILGGDTVIGRGSRIGGNVWLTRSVPPYSVVTPTAGVDRRDGSRAEDDDLLEFNI